MPVCKTVDASLSGSLGKSLLSGIRTGNNDASLGPWPCFYFTNLVNHHVSLHALNSRKFGAHCGMAWQFTGLLIEGS